MKKGFTLIELLAVIVILAIIALIATPIVLSIIEETKDNASLRSAEFYLDAVENSIAIATLNNRRITEGVYNIIDGDICLDTNCTDKLIVEINGEKPNSGEITIQNGKIEDIKLNLNDKTISKNETGQLVYLELKYTIGQEVTYNPGDQDRTWNVIDESATTVTLLLTENLGNAVAWYAYENQNVNTNSYGPKDALEYLNILTASWSKVEPIKNYSYTNNLNGTEKPNGYQKIEIQNGKTKLTHKDGTIITEVTGTSRARLLTLEEVFEISIKTKESLKEENLRAFIGRNLDALNTKLGTSLETVDDAIEYVVNNSISWVKDESKYLQTYYTGRRMIINYDIETTYDILLPSYLYQNLYSDENTSLAYGYWTLSAYAYNDDYAWDMDYDGYVDTSNVDGVGGDVLRPVITVSKLNKREIK